AIRRTGRVVIGRRRRGPARRHRGIRNVRRRPRIVEGERPAYSQRRYPQGEIGPTGARPADRLDADLAGALADGARAEARDLGVASPGLSFGEEFAAAARQHGEGAKNNRTDEVPTKPTHHGMDNASGSVNTSSTFRTRTPPLVSPARYGLRIANEAVVPPIFLHHLQQARLGTSNRKRHYNAQSRWLQPAARGQEPRGR